MSREVPVRFCEGSGVRLPRSTRLLILCRSQEEAESALRVARKILGRLKLELSEEKTVVSSFEEGFDFLGFRFAKRSRGVGQKSLEGFYRKIREKTRRQQGDRPLRAVIADLNPILVGWGRYHREGQNLSLFKRLDTWVRNRLRAYVRKRWRDRGRWKIFSWGELAALGLRSLHSLVRGSGQLLLFGSSP